MHTVIARLAFRWVTFFLVTFVVALPGLALLWWKREMVRGLG